MQYDTCRYSLNDRTRLYQIAINKVSDKIKSEINIFGYFDYEWIPFEPNKTFGGFLISKNSLA